MKQVSLQFFATFLRLALLAFVQTTVPEAIAQYSTGTSSRPTSLTPHRNASQARQHMLSTTTITGHEDVPSLPMATLKTLSACAQSQRLDSTAHSGRPRTGPSLSSAPSSSRQSTVPSRRYFPVKYHCFGRHDIESGARDVRVPELHNLAALLCGNVQQLHRLLERRNSVEACAPVLIHRPKCQSWMAWLSWSTLPKQRWASFQIHIGTKLAERW